MKLLIITQSVDRKDTVLGFFHEWIRELSLRFESVVTICLKEGDHNLPSNVRVLSLGKEGGRSRIKYAINFYRHIWKERSRYDAVFVHMNQEYVLLGSLIWRILGKKVYLWRNHHAGNIFTDIASYLSHKVFCTSKFSYTAKYKNTLLMPVAVDIDKFKAPDHLRVPNSILFLARMAPVKKPDLLARVLQSISGKCEFSATFVGDPMPSDEEYYRGLKDSVKELENIEFKNGVPNEDTPPIYATHDIFVNLSSSGMYDKTIIEAAASGCMVLASNENLRGDIDDMFIFKEGNEEELRVKLKILLTLSDERRQEARLSLQNFAKDHSLKELSDRLSGQINSV